MASSEKTDTPEEYMKRIQQVLRENKHIKEIQVVGENVEHLEKEDLSAAWVNIVWRLWHGSKTNSVVVKIAPPYFKLFGPDYPLSTIRQEKESKCLQKLNELSPGSCPRVWCYSKKHSTIVMEDIRGSEQLKVQLERGDVDMSTIQNATKIVAQFHIATHFSQIPDTEFAKLLKEFPDDDMTKLTGTVIFDWPQKAANSLEKLTEEAKDIIQEIREDPILMETTDKLRKIFWNTKECLIHGDLYSGSFLVKDGTPLLFDTETCRAGSMSYDLAHLLCSYVMVYYYHWLSPVDKVRHTMIAKQIIKVCHVTIETFLECLKPHGITEDSQFIPQLMSETAGFLAMYLIGVLLAGGPLTEVATEAHRVEMLQCGLRLLRSIDSIEDVYQLTNVAMP